MADFPQFRVPSGQIYQSLFVELHSTVKNKLEMESGVLRGRKTCCAFLSRMRSHRPAVFDFIGWHFRPFLDQQARGENPATTSKIVVLVRRL